MRPTVLRLSLSLSLSLWLLLAAACSAAPPVGTRHRMPARRLAGRLVGGEPVDISQHPWMVSVQVVSGHVCGGTVISPTVVLTAAHCIALTPGFLFSVRGGSSTHESGGTVYKVSSVAWHSYFSYDTGEYDIGFLGVSDPISEQAVSLATSELEAGSSATVTGWGSGAADEDYSEQLRAAAVTVVERSACRELLGAGITDNVLCAADSQGDNVAACGGDDGGPLVVGSTQYGIVSWGRGCGVAGYPGAYTNVAALRDWISGATGV